MKCHFFDNFGKTVNLNFDGLTGVNSLCSISNQEMTKRGRFLYRYKLIVRSLRVVDRYQNLYGTTTNDGESHFGAAVSAPLFRRWTFRRRTFRRQDYSAPELFFLDSLF